MYLGSFVLAVTNVMKPVASLRFWKATTVLALMVNLMPLSLAAEYEYVSWKSTDTIGGGRAYDKPPQCVPIPDDLRLCHGVGYNQMLLPNLLEHESMAEVRQQAGSWVPLVHKACHPSTRILLCSLFAPVCMDRPVYPCRLLCESVRQGCEPIMEAFGFPWPEMLACDKFPQGDVCISTPNNTDTFPESGKFLDIKPDYIDLKW